MILKANTEGADRAVRILRMIWACVSAYVPKINLRKVKFTSDNLTSNAIAFYREFSTFENRIHFCRFPPSFTIVITYLSSG